jgi:hypothetical protein
VSIAVVFVHYFLPFIVPNLPQSTITMTANIGNQRIIPLDEGWNDEIKAKVSHCTVDAIIHAL